MHDGVLEKHQVHGFAWVLAVVLTEELSESLSKGIEILNTLVFLLHVGIVPEQNFLDVTIIPLKLEVVLDVALNECEEPLPILLIDQPIIENS